MLKTCALHLGHDSQAGSIQLLLGKEKASLSGLVNALNAMYNLAFSHSKNKEAGASASQKLERRFHRLMCANKGAQFSHSIPRHAFPKKFFLSQVCPHAYFCSLIIKKRPWWCFERKLNYSYFYVAYLSAFQTLKVMTKFWMMSILSLVNSVYIHTTHLFYRCSAKLCYRSAGS